MADNVLINTGTGATIKTDQVGTAHYQVVKVALGSADTASLLPVGQQVMADSLPVVIASNQSAIPIVFTPAGTQDVKVTNAVAMSGTGNVTIAGTPTVTASQGGTWNIATVSTCLGVVNYNFNKLLGEDPLIGEGVSGVGVQRVTIANNGSGRLQLVATVSTVGSILAMPVLSASNVTIASMPVLSASNVTIASITTGTMNVINVLSASGVTIASLPAISGSISVINTPVITATISNNPLICTAANVTIASVTTGTMNVINVLSATGVLLGATTGAVGMIVDTRHPQRFQAYGVSVTSAAGGTIIQTSGAHTLYITDFICYISATNTVAICSETTVLARVYGAGNFAHGFSFSQPLVCNTAQSIRTVCGAASSASLTIVGYTVT